MQKKFLVIVSLLVGGFVLANSAGSFTVPAIPLILNFVMSIAIALTFFKPKFVHGLEFAMVLIFTTLALPSLEFAGVYISVHALVNASIAVYKIIPAKESE
jgi:hypothetical protein